MTALELATARARAKVIGIYLEEGLVAEARGALDHLVAGLNGSAMPAESAGGGV